MCHIHHDAHGIAVSNHVSCNSDVEFNDNRYCPLARTSPVRRDPSQLANVSGAEAAGQREHTRKLGSPQSEYMYAPGADAAQRVPAFIDELLVPGEVCCWIWSWKKVGTC